MDWFGGYITGGYHIPIYWGGDGAALPEPVATMPDLSWVNGVYVSLLVTDHRGVPIGDLEAELESVAWLLNETSVARLTAAVPRTAAELLQIGNRLLIEFDNGLPRWAGVIDLPRRWAYGQVRLTAYSGHRLLDWRVTGRDRRFERVAAGGALRGILQEQDAPAVVLPGSIWLGGPALSLEYHREALLKALEDMSAKAAADFDVTGQMENGRLVFRVHLYERLGVERPNVYFIEGVNASVESLEEQGPIVNEWFTAGAGAGWGETGRLYGHARDGVSVGDYGLRQDAAVWSDIDDGATLDARTAVSLAATREMYAALDVSALNLPPGRFADYDIGDGVGVALFSMPSGGLEARRRVVGREFRPRDGACEVLLL